MSQTFAQTRRRRRVAQRTRRLTNTQVINKVRRDVNILKKQVDVKFFDSTVDDAVVAATGIVNGQIFTIPDGQTQSEKDGLKVTIKSIQLRFQLSIPTTVTVADATDVCRFMLLRDKQANGALPAVVDILAQADIQSFKQLEQVKRFVTLFDKTVSINSMGGFGDGTTNAVLPNTKSWQVFKKMNLEIIYNDTATTGVITTIVSNNLVLLYISEKGKCGVKCKVRVRYTD